MNILKENQVLLSKLVEIVGRRKSATIPEMSTLGSVIMNTQRRSVKTPNLTQVANRQQKDSVTIIPSAHHPSIPNFSLNAAWRRKERERIERENHLIVNRLDSQKSGFSRTQFENDYRLVKRWQKIIRRVQTPLNTNSSLL